MKWKCISSIAVAALLGISTSALAGSVTLAPSQDTTLFQNNSNAAFGAGNVIFSGTNSGISARRGIIQFDVAGSTIPTNATITSVQLLLDFQQSAGSGGGTGGGGGGGLTPPANITIGLYDASKDWGEGVAGKNSTSGSGSSAAATGDATWSSNHFGQSTWTNLGGDFSSTASATLTEASASLPTTFTWGSTSQMVADVQSWLTSPSTNHGWFLVNSDETDAQTFISFWSRETSGSGTAPQLQIAFTPEPSTIFAAAGLITLFNRRHRSKTN
jgi:hypothetical protein